MPFTVQEFFEVFTRYNNAVWPMQVVLTAMAVTAAVLVYSKAGSRSVAVRSIMAFLWAWMGIAYHVVHFTSINRAAWLFGGLFVVQAVLLGWGGRRSARLGFDRPSGAGAVVGWILIVYGLVIYPLLGWIAGHAYMSSPTFGAPCPTVIFTFGLLWLARRPFSRYLLIIPLIWAGIGGSAAVNLGVPQDYGLIAAGASGIYLLFIAGGKQSDDS